MGGEGDRQGGRESVGGEGECGREGGKTVWVCG